MIRVGIFFGGQSREREVSFAGGRTVYDNLDKTKFEAVPIFVDSLGQFILLDWQYIYKGTIRDFYPSVATLSDFGHNITESPFQIYAESLGLLSDQEREAMANQIGKRVFPHQFGELMDLAFLALHGPYGEDGNIQGILEWYGIPYSGSGILGSAIGIDKVAQSDLMEGLGFPKPSRVSLERSTWLDTNKDRHAVFAQLNQMLGADFVVKSPSQGSSIGVSVLKSPSFEAFEAAVNRSFFIIELNKDDWEAKSQEERVLYLRTLIDIREGIGLPVYAEMLDGAKMWIYHPNHLLMVLNGNWTGTIRLSAYDGESSIFFEKMLTGKEFSCIVVQDEMGRAIALPPTEIVKQTDFFDYRAKYLPGISRKVTPIDLPDPVILTIREECSRLYTALGFNVYARIDGFVTHEGHIFLNDPNTTSGMMPSSFFFHQAAEIGLNPSQFLTFIIRTSLAERKRTGKNLVKIQALLDRLDYALSHAHSEKHGKVRVAVIMGGYSSERHISVESGRNVYEKLSSSAKYEPFPVFVTGSDMGHELWAIPINYMLKDNADDIREKVKGKQKTHRVIELIRDEATSITQKYAGAQLFKAEQLSYKELCERTDTVFIALHGRPGEDGQVQRMLDRYRIPYNGSGVASSQITINKYDTNEILMANGFLVANHMLVADYEWRDYRGKTLKTIEDAFNYPLIAKPADDGCSSAVKKIKNQDELAAFADMMFRETEAWPEEPAEVLKLKPSEEFPKKKYFLIESLITAEGAEHFLEVTGGILTHYNEEGEIAYTAFEASEALASGEVLSLEEKFLAGEGQNITPARYAMEPADRQRVSDEVKQTLARVAKVLDVQGYCRIDAFVRVFADGKVETIIVEVNSLPGMTPATCIFHQSAIEGLKPYQFIDAILNFGMERTQRTVEA